GIFHSMESATEPGDSIMASATTRKPRAGADQDVLTLSEAAAYLRVSEDVLQQLATERMIPARQIGPEWRFLKKAIQDWLSCDPLVAELERRLAGKPHSTNGPRAKNPANQWLLDLAGAWKDFPEVDEMLKEIYQRRGRPMVEEDE